MPSFPIQSASALGLGQTGGSTQAPALVQGVGYVANLNDPPSAAIWCYPSSTDPTSLTGQVPGGMIYGLGSYAGQVYVVNDSGVPVMWADNGSVVAPIASTAVASASTLDIDSVGALQINSSGGAIGIGNDAVAQAINIGTGAAARTITVGNSTTTTALVLSSGTGGVSVGGPLKSPVTASQSIADNGTITLPTTGFNKLIATSTAANKTGVILTAGTIDGQTICLINTTAANSITFAAAGTSNVADGTSAVIPALRAMIFTWDAGTARWYRQGA